jgi:hypothetical protein
MSRDQMTVEGGVTVALNESQVATVVRKAAAGSGLHGLLLAITSRAALTGLERQISGDSRYSRSLLRALLVLAAVPANGEPREVAEVAQEAELSPSTAYRYLQTWLASGVLEQNPRTRRYMRVLLEE